MNNFINRNFSLTENDDWKLNVQPRMGNLTESVEMRGPDGSVLGWKLIGRFE